METPHNYLQWTMDDIVFDNRNKTYGAYQLRQLTKDHLRTGLFITVFLACLFIGLSFIDWTFGNPQPEEPHIDVVLDPSFVELPVLQIQKPITTTAAISLSQQHVEMKVVKQTPPNTDEEPARIEELLTKSIGSETVEGTGTASTGFVSAPSTVETTSEPYSSFGVEVAPVFPGGDAALINFLANHAVYPAMERDNNIDGKVLLRFVVMEDGAVANVSVIKGVSAGLDKEAMRVVKMLPNFIPGKQHGKAVKVYFNIPMVFKLK